MHVLQQITSSITTGSNHKACVCVICDCFIIEVEKYAGYQKKNAIQFIFSVNSIEVSVTLQHLKITH